MPGHPGRGSQRFPTGDAEAACQEATRRLHQTVAEGDWTCILEATEGEFCYLLQDTLGPPMNYYANEIGRVLQQCPPLADDMRRRIPNNRRVGLAEARPVLEGASYDLSNAWIFDGHDQGNGHIRITLLAPRKKGAIRLQGTMWPFNPVPIVDQLWRLIIVAGGPPSMIDRTGSNASARWWNRRQICAHIPEYVA